MNTIFNIMAMVGLIALIAMVLGFAVACCVASYTLTIQFLLG